MRVNILEDMDGEFGDDEDTDDEASLAPSDVTNEVSIQMFTSYTKFWKYATADFFSLSSRDFHLNYFLTYVPRAHTHLQISLALTV